MLRHHLKNYFVPHDGNNHIPHALKTKRLLFHVGAAIAVKALVFVFIAAYPLAAWMTPDLAAKESKKIIAATNELRAGLKLAPLSENAKLDQAAADKVSDMLLNQYFAHVSPSGTGLQTFIKNVGYDYAMAGENLAMGFSDAADVMPAWEKSPTHYANLIDPNFKEIGAAMDSGRFAGVDTTFTAQYFGRPTQTLAAAVAAPVKKISLPRETAVLTIKSPVAAAAKVVNVAVKLPAATKAATAVIDNTKIVLAPQGSGAWQGTALVDKVEEKNMTAPVVPASVELVEADGTKAVAELDWQNIVPSKVTAYDQYTVFKHAPTAAMRAAMRVGDVYFYVLLAILAAALVNLIIFRKKHHQHILATSIASVVILVILVIS